MYTLFVYYILAAGNACGIAPLVNAHMCPHALICIKPSAIVVYGCIGHIAANGYAVGRGGHYAYAAPERAALHQYGAACVVLCFALIAPPFFAAAALPWSG